MVGNPTLADHRPDVVSAGAPRSVPPMGVEVVMGRLAARRSRWRVA